MAEEPQEKRRVVSRKPTGKVRPTTQPAHRREQEVGPSNPRRYYTSGDEWLLLPGQKNYIRVRDGAKRPPLRLKDKQPAEQEEGGLLDDAIDIEKKPEDDEEVKKARIQDAPVPPIDVHRRDLLTLWYEAYFSAIEGGYSEESAYNYATSVIVAKEASTPLQRLRKAFTGLTEKLHPGPYTRHEAGTEVTDSTGGKAGGQFKEEDGKKTGGIKEHKPAPFSKKPNYYDAGLGIKDRHKLVEGFMKVLPGMTQSQVDAWLTKQNYSQEDIKAFLRQIEMNVLQMPRLSHEDLGAAIARVEDAWREAIEDGDDEAAWNAWTQMSKLIIPNELEKIVNRESDYNREGMAAVVKYQDGLYDEINGLLREGEDFEFDFIGSGTLYREAIRRAKEAGIPEGIEVEFEQKYDLIDRPAGTIYTEERRNPEYDLFIQSQIKEQTQELILGIDEAMDTNKLTVPITSWRGVNQTHLGMSDTNVVGEVIDEANEMKGTVFTDAGFVSTTLNMTKAAEFSERQTLIELRLPAGIPAVGLLGDDDVNNYNEQEVLLDRDMEYVILGGREQRVPGHGIRPVIMVQVLKPGQEASDVVKSA